MILREIASIIIVAVIAIIGIGSAVVFNKPDNPVEETSEVLIESLSGVDLDLTPGSPEFPGEDADCECKNKVSEHKEDLF